MPKTSAGLLMYEREKGELKFLLGHPGGPFFEKKDEGAWSIPKGEAEEAEDLLETAKREFFEETGIKPKEPFIYLGEIKQKSGKIVHCWAFEGKFPGMMLRQHMFKMEWPPKSGKFQEFPELDKAEMFSKEDAGKKINPAQLDFIERLEKFLEKEH